MSGAVDELWSVTRDSVEVDAETLARAVEGAVAGAPLDYRTRLLVRDSVWALESTWGLPRFKLWLERSPYKTQIQATVDSEFDEDEIAFPSLRRRVVDATRPENVLRVFREISAHVSQPVRIIVGGSIAVILQGHLTRHTEDIDLVDEVPAELRSQHELLDNIERLYGLRLTHFQSHYLPAGWEQRIGSVGTFGKLQVFAVDVYDVFVGKLFSARIKDRGDLQDMSSRLQQETLLRRVRETTSALRSDARLLDAAKHNWFVLFGEQLPA